MIGSSRDRQRKKVEQKLGRRRLLWFGTRGTDATPLFEFGQFAGCYSLIAPLRGLGDFVHESLEEITGHRVDLNSYNTDSDNSTARKRLHKSLLLGLSHQPAALIAYRPASFLSSAYFPRMHQSQYLGIFAERQMAFEHKPWVEQELRKLGVRTIPYKYFADEDFVSVSERIPESPAYVLRLNKSSGGSGLVVVDHLTQLKKLVPKHHDGFFSIAPFLSPNIPLNIGGCVFQSGHVTLHTPSIQIIGAPECTSRQLGYCGNDFARVADLPSEWMNEIEDVGRRVGKWLHSTGYWGAFGIDYIIAQGEIYLTEVNARFQGSSQVSARLSRSIGIPDVFSDHLAAQFSDMEPDSRPRLSEQAREQEKISHVFVYNTKASPVQRSCQAAPIVGMSDSQIDLIPEHGTTVAQEAILFRSLIEQSVIDDNGRIVDSVCRQITDITRLLYCKTDIHAIGNQP